MKDLSSCVRPFLGAIREEFCEEVIREFENDPEWAPATIEDTSLSGFRVCDVLPISKSEVRNTTRRMEIDQDIFSAVSGVVGEYLSDFPYGHVTRDSGYDLLRYHPGGKYDFHTDSGPSADYIRTLSVIINLSPADHYTGGELEFEDGPRFKLSAGDIVVFPSSFLFPHRITPIETGTRHSIVTWLH